MKDWLGNELQRYDVIHHGGRDGDGSGQRLSVVLETAKAGLRVVFGTIEREWLERPTYEPGLGHSWRRLTEGVLGPPKLVLHQSTLKEQYKKAVKVHPDLFDDATRDLVAAVKEQF